MEKSFYNLSGGLNQALTKTELGSNTNKVFWSDCENVEIYKNRGIIQQKGNTLFVKLPIEEKIVTIKEISKKESLKLFIATDSGKMYIYDYDSKALTLLSKTIQGKNLKTATFLDGLLVITENDGLFFIKNNPNYDIVDCNLKDDDNNISVVEINGAPGTPYDVEDKDALLEKNIKFYASLVKMIDKML